MLDFNLLPSRKVPSFRQCQGEWVSDADNGLAPDLVF